MRTVALGILPTTRNIEGLWFTVAPNETYFPDWRIGGRGQMTRQAGAQLLSNILRDIRDNPQDAAFLCALSVTADLGAMAVAGGGAALAKPAANWVREVIQPPLESNHRLLQLVHECKWEAVRVICLELHQDDAHESTFDNSKLLNEIYEIAKYRKDLDISSNLDPRHDTGPPRPTALERCVNLLFRSTERNQTPRESYDAADRRILKELEHFLGREPHHQSDHWRAQALYEVSSQAAGELLLDQIFRIRFPGGGQHHNFHDKRSSNPSLDEFLKAFEDPQRGWAATFRVILKDEVTTSAGGEANRILVNLASETRILELDTNRLVKGLDERIWSVEATLVDIKESFKDYQQPTLRLEDSGSDTKTGYVRFLSYVYSSRNTDFVGRQSEKAELDRFLSVESSVSWWQIAGAGGQGKSRLALEVVRDAKAAGWHAGFLRYEVLKEKLDWATLPIDRPTLCVVDYVAAPEKAKLVASALLTIFKRSSEQHADWDRPNLQKFRLLLVEREPYHFEGEAGVTATEKRALWFHYFIDAGMLQAISDTAYSRRALELQELTPENMTEIAQSWRKHQGQPELTPHQLDQLLTSMGRSTRDDQHSRAWRPLFAMVMADSIAGRPADEVIDLSESLRLVLDEETKTHWRGEAGEPVVPRQAARRLAALATIVGSLDSRAASLQDDFYENASGDTISEALMVLGYRITPAEGVFADPLPLTARTPDLLGEYMVHWLNLSNSDKERLIRDAWLIDASSVFMFLLRMSEDHQDIAATETYKSFAALRPPDGVIPWTKPDVFIAAAYAGLLGGLSRALETGISPDEQLSGTVALSLRMAAQNGHTKVVDILLQQPGINVNQQDPESGLFPLLLAAQNGHTEVVDRLLQHKGIEVNQPNPETGSFPLLLAAQNGHTEVVDRLLQHEDISVNQKDLKRGTFALLQAAQNGHTEVITALIKKQPDIGVNACAKTGAFPLLLAAENGHTEVVDMLLQQEGIDVNQQDPENGSFPLLMAAGNGNAGTLHLLVQEGADIQKICSYLEMNSLELCLTMLTELVLEGHSADKQLRQRLEESAWTLLELGATLQDGSRPIW